MSGNLRKLLIVGLVLAGTAESEAKAASQDATEAPLKIAIHVINNAHLEERDLEEAGEIATDIFRRMGIETIVALQFDKRSHEMALKLPRNCRFYAFIVANEQAKRMGLEQYKKVLGQVRCSVEDENCSCICIFDQAIDRLLREMKMIDKPLLLGYAMAHEIGHILLRRESHSQSGVMLGNWGSGALFGMLKGTLSFHPTEAADILKEVASRNLRNLDSQVSEALIANAND